MYCLLYWHKSNSEKKKLPTCCRVNPQGIIFQEVLFKVLGGFSPLLRMLMFPPKKASFIEPKSQACSFWALKKEK